MPQQHIGKDLFVIAFIRSCDVCRVYCEPAVKHKGQVVAVNSGGVFACVDERAQLLERLAYRHVLGNRISTVRRLFQREGDVEFLKVIQDVVSLAGDDARPRRDFPRVAVERAERVPRSLLSAPNEGFDNAVLLEQIGIAGKAVVFVEHFDLAVIGGNAVGKLFHAVRLFLKHFDHRKIVREKFRGQAV